MTDLDLTAGSQETVQRTHTLIPQNEQKSDRTAQNITFQMNQDIYTATALIWESKIDLLRSEYILLIFSALFSLALQYSLVFVWYYSEANEVEINIVDIDLQNWDGERIYGEDATITQYLSPPRSGTQKAMILLIASAVFVYVARQISDNISIFIIAVVSRFWYVYVVIIFLQAGLHSYAIRQIMDVLVVQASINDTLAVALGFFFLLEIDDWMFVLIEPNIDFNGKFNKELFNWKVKSLEEYPELESILCFKYSRATIFSIYCALFAIGVLLQCAAYTWWMSKFGWMPLLVHFYILIILALPGIVLIGKKIKKSCL
eukprot:60785_1